MRESVDIHVSQIGCLKRIGYPETASAPFVFGVRFSYEGEFLTERMGFHRVKIEFDAGESLGSIELIRADRGEGGLHDVIMERDCPEGDGLKLITREYTFVAWEIRDKDLVFIGCFRDGSRHGKHGLSHRDVKIVEGINPRVKRDVYIKLMDDPNSDNDPRWFLLKGLSDGEVPVQTDGFYTKEDAESALVSHYIAADADLRNSMEEVTVEASE